MEDQGTTTWISYVLYAHTYVCSHNISLCGFILYPAMISVVTCLMYDEKLVGKVII